MSDLENDLEKWTRDKLLATLRDAGMRCEAAGIDDNGFTLITALIVNIAAGLVSRMSMASSEAGQMFAEAVSEHRRLDQ
jgi:triphosphoribosyl-dephospho-CoA synthetase